MAKILVVHDSGVSRRPLSTILEPAVHMVVVAADGIAFRLSKVREKRLCSDPRRLSKAEIYPVAAPWVVSRIGCQTRLEGRQMNVANEGNERRLAVDFDAAALLLEVRARDGDIPLQALGMLLPDQLRELVDGHA